MQNDTAEHNPQHQQSIGVSLLLFKTTIQELKWDKMALHCNIFPINQKCSDYAHFNNAIASFPFHEINEKFPFCHLVINTTLW